MILISPTVYLFQIVHQDSFSNNASQGNLGMRLGGCGGCGGLWASSWECNAVLAVYGQHREVQCGWAVCGHPREVQCGLGSLPAFPWECIYGSWESSWECTAVGRLGGWAVVVVGQFMGLPLGCNAVWAVLAVSLPSPGLDLRFGRFMVIPLE